MYIFVKIHEFYNKGISISMRLFLLCLLLATATLAPAQTIQHGAIVIGRVDSVASAVLKEQRKLWVYVPASAGDPTSSPQHYPVVYLLDGDDHFASATGVMQYLSQVSICPEMIVVGIPNTKRTRDLTTSQPAHTEGMSADELKAAGGGENFTAFLEKELIPYIDAHYPTTPHRTLIGHSLGGLLVLNTLVNHPSLFDNYVALDPSMWWDDEKLLKQTHDVLAQPRFAGRALFVASANVTGLDSVQAAKDPHTRAKWKLRDELTRNRSNGLRWAYKYYPTDTHGSVPLLGTYDALHFLFQGYALPLAFNNDLYKPGANVVALLETHYQQFSTQAGYLVLPPESLVNGIAYGLLSLERPAAALSLFQLNVRNYPASFNVHDSLGDYYLAQKQPALAVAAFTKALQLKENPASRAKLIALQAKGKKKR
jgi:predicted alpha/beta superfamily hydrolase